MPYVPAPAIESADRAALRRALLGWYDAHRRDLPWRHSPANPYHVLVSEAMLQQTQVATVIPYFERFIERFPTLAALAGADEQEVLRLWQGLGYYRRARNLHAAALAVLADYGGRIPDTVDALGALPGVGRYTAGAMASIAFGRRAAVVDGNVARVLARCFAVDEPVDAAATKEKLWSLAQQLVPRGRPGDFNQALMELGAMICAPTSPRCMTCPIAKRCRANLAGRTEELPHKSAARRQRPVHHHVLAIGRRGRYLMQRRGDAGLWSGMWQLPTAEDFNAEITGETLQKWIEGATNLRVSVPESISRFEHLTTHLRISFEVWRCEAMAGRAPRSGSVWRSLDDVDDLPLSNPQRRAMAMLGAAD